MKKVLKKISRGFIIVVLNIVFRTVYRMKVVGTENIPKEGALIFCGNHKTYLDPPAITVTNGRKMSFMAKEQLKENWLFAFLGWAFEAIYVKRDSKDIGPLKQALTILKSGDCLGIFPEGTRNKTKEFLLPFKFGTVSMASKTDATIVPFGVTGEYKFRSKDLVIRFGEPFKIGDMTLEEANEKLRNEVGKLMQKNLKEQKKLNK